MKLQNNVDLKDILLLVGANGSLSSVSVRDDIVGGILNPTEERVYTINASLGGNFTTGDIVGAAVAPVIFTGNEEITCDNSGSTIILKACP